LNAYGKYQNRLTTVTTDLIAKLKQGAAVWNGWRVENRSVIGIDVDLAGADLSGVNLSGADLSGAKLMGANFHGTACLDTDFTWSNLTKANFRTIPLRRANFSHADLTEADFSGADLRETNLLRADLTKARLSNVRLGGANLRDARLTDSQFRGAEMYDIAIASSDLSHVRGLANVSHLGPSSISTDTFALSEGQIPEEFLRGCGLPDWEIEVVKLHRTNLSNEDVNAILYKIYDLRATQALQISPLFVSYSHRDSEFVDKMGASLTQRGIRYWRDTHDMKAGRIEKQIDRAIRQNPTVLLVLSKHSLSSDWVEHEVRMARGLEKEMGRDALCPVALDDSWKDSRWPKRIIEQVMEYNILDFSAWRADSKFDGMFRRLIDGLQLFYKG
jgi:uncharacterized protein YjbI with pentapeptide repeats